VYLTLKPQNTQKAVEQKGEKDNSIIRPKDFNKVEDS
jgi:hypothetical protein